MTLESFKIILTWEASTSDVPETPTSSSTPSSSLLHTKRAILSEKPNVASSQRVLRKRSAETAAEPPAKRPALENDEKLLEEKREALKYIPL